MKGSRRWSLPSVLCLLSSVFGILPSASAATIERHGGAIVFSSDTCILAFSDENGSIQSLTTSGKSDSILQSGEGGLWQATCADGSTVNATDFAAGSSARPFRWSTDRPGQTLYLNYVSADLGVTVTVAGRPDGVDFTARVEPARPTVLELTLPARVRFDPNQIDRLVCPLNGNESVGAAFRPPFFQRQSADHPAGWQTQMVGPSGFISLFGTGAVMRADNDPPVPITITADGLTWLGSDLAAKWDGKPALVNRPSPPDSRAIVLADSPNGPYFSGTCLGRQGLLFRLGRPGRHESGAAGCRSGHGRPRTPRTAAPANAVEDRFGGFGARPVHRRLDRRAGKRLAHPPRGLRRDQSSEVPNRRADHAGAMLGALAGTDFLAILNPYGEFTPVLEETGMPGTVAAIGKYVKTGGNWFEVGGYSFYYELRPTHYYSYGTPYPPAFADFLHLDAPAGSVSLFGIQPMQWQPWGGSSNPAALFVPGRLAWVATTRAATVNERSARTSLGAVRGNRRSCAWSWATRP